MDALSACIVNAQSPYLNQEKNKQEEAVERNNMTIQKELCNMALVGCFIAWPVAVHISLSVRLKRRMRIYLYGSTLYIALIPFVVASLLSKELSAESDIYKMTASHTPHALWARTPTHHLLSNRIWLIEPRTNHFNPPYFLEIEPKKTLSHRLLFACDLLSSMICLASTNFAHGSFPFD